MCHLVSFLLHFHPTCPLFTATIKPFHASLKFPRPPPRSLLLFPSVYLLLSFSLCLLLLLLPSLFCSPAAHKNSSFLSPEDCSVAQGFTAFLYAFSVSLYLSPLVSLSFGSTTQHLIQPIFCFVFLTHLYPSLSPSVFSFSIPVCLYNNTY